MRLITQLSDHWIVIILCILLYSQIIGIKFAKDLEVPAASLAAWYFTATGITFFVLNHFFPQLMGIMEGTNAFFPSIYILGVGVFAVLFGVPFYCLIISKSYASGNEGGIFLLIGIAPLAAVLTIAFIQKAIDLLTALLLLAGGAMLFFAFYRIFAVQGNQN